MLRYRFVVMLVSLTWLTLAGASAQAATPTRTAYVVIVHTESWMPIAEHDVQAAIGQAVVTALSGAARFTFVRGTYDPVTRELQAQGAEAVLEIHADIIGEAGTLSLSLLLRPNQGHRIASAASAATATIARQSKSEMLRRILAAATDAAHRLSRAVDWSRDPEPVMGRSAARKAVFQWSPLSIPRPRVNNKDVLTFGNPRLRTDLRLAAGERLAAVAYDQADVRHSLETAVLTDPNPRIRCMAMNFLEPASRAYALTQRVILEAARTDAEPTVRFAAFLMSRSFVAQLPTETLQTWAELLSATSSEFPDFQRLAAWVSDFGDRVPNLEAALFACVLRADPLVTGSDSRRRDCLTFGVRALPEERQFWLLRAYLDHSRKDPTLVPAIYERLGELNGPFRKSYSRGCSAGVCDGPVQWSAAGTQALLRFALDALFRADPQLVGRTEGNTTYGGPMGTLLRTLSGRELAEQLTDRDVDQLLALIDRHTDPASETARRMLDELVATSNPPWGGALLGRNLQKITAAYKRWDGRANKGRTNRSRGTGSLDRQATPWRTKLRDALIAARPAALSKTLDELGELSARDSGPDSSAQLESVEALRWIGETHRELGARALAVLRRAQDARKRTASTGTYRESLLTLRFQQAIRELEHPALAEKSARRDPGEQRPERHGSYWLSLPWFQSPRRCQLQGD